MTPVIERIVRKPEKFAVYINTWRSFSCADVFNLFAALSHHEKRELQSGDYVWLDEEIGINGGVWAFVRVKITRIEPNGDMQCTSGSHAAPLPKTIFRLKDEQKLKELLKTVPGASDISVPRHHPRR